MENPESEISGVILRLTQGSPQVQSNTIDQYFTSNAVFVHPFCRTWDIDNGRWYVKKIYQWYKVMSPEIQLTVNSIAFDKDHLKLYVNISQVFSIWAVPFHSSDVTLTTVLSLTERVDGAMPGANGNQSGKTRYYIARQEDLYQTSEFVKFLMPCVAWLVYIWQTLATLFCVLGVMFSSPRELVWSLIHLVGSTLAEVFNKFYCSKK